MRREQLPTYVTDELVQEMQDLFKDTERDRQFYRKHERQWIQEYPEQWVAVHGEQVVAVADTQREVIEQAQAKGAPRRGLIVEYVRATPINVIGGRIQ